MSAQKPMLIHEEVRAFYIKHDKLLQACARPGIVNTLAESLRAQEKELNKIVAHYKELGKQAQDKFEKSQVVEDITLGRI
jgi:hypothetical protein